MSCPICNDSKQIRKMIYSDLYKKEIPVSVTCQCAMKEAMKIYFEPIEIKRQTFKTQSKIELDVYDLDDQIVFISGKRSLVYKALESLLKKLCVKRGWAKVPKYQFVQDSEVWTLWWERSTLCKKRLEWADNHLILFEIGNKTDTHSLLPKCLLEQLADFISFGSKVWVLYFGEQDFYSSIYCSKEFQEFLKEAGVKMVKVKECR